MKVIVVGAGVVGLSVAWACIKQGYEVTIIDRGPTPNPASASYDQHRMIRPHYGAQQGYTAMVQDALKAWDVLWHDLGQSYFERTGVLAVDLGDNTWMEASAEALKAVGVSHQRLSGSELAEVAPMLGLPANAWGLLAQDAGVLLADRIVQSVASWVERAGGDLRPHSPIIGIDLQGNSITLEGGQRLQADRVIVAAGAWTPQLLPEFRSRLTPVQSTVAYISPPQNRTDDWATTPALFLMTQEAHLYALPPVAGTELKFGGARVLREVDPMAAVEIEPDDLTRTLVSFRPFLHEPEDYQVLRGAAGIYADPADKRFVAAERGQTLVISGCGGRMFKFGALFGQAAAEWARGRIGGDQITAWASGSQ